MASLRRDARGGIARKIMMAIVAAFMALAILPHDALAREYAIRQVDIEATVEADGGVTVWESRQFDFDGSFHGVYWKIPTGSYQGKTERSECLILNNETHGYITLLYCMIKGLPPGSPCLLLSENPALDAGFRERYAFDQKSSKP